MRWLPLLALFAACDDRAAAPDRAPGPSRAVQQSSIGQLSPTPSPDGRVVARVPIVALPGRDFATWWRPEIVGPDGTILFVDEQGFPARFNVYWDWDARGRLWLYETDMGGLWVYAEEGGAWVRRTPREGEEPPPVVSVGRGPAR